MQILENTRNKLIFKREISTTFSLFQLIFLLSIFGLFGLFCASFFLINAPLSVSFNCVRTLSNGGSCQLIHQTLLKSTKQNIQIKTLHVAQVEEIISEEDKNVKSYQLFILTETGKEYLFDSSNNKQEIQATAFKIASFIGNPGQTNLMLKENYTENVYNSFLMILLVYPGFFAIILIPIFLLSLNSITYSFDQNIGLLSVSYKFNPGYKFIRNYPIYKISNIKFEKTKDNEEEETIYKLYIVLKSGGKIDFNDYTDTSDMEKDKSLICSFLNLPMKEEA